MSLSAFDDKYIFYGFLPKKNKELEKICSQLKNLDFALIFFIPAIKINFYINYFKKFFLERSIFIAREMTKIHETFYRSDLKSLENLKKAQKGEITVILSKKISNNSEQIVLDNEVLNKELSKYLKRYSLKDVVKLVSERNNLPKKLIYDLCLKLKKK